MKFAVNYSAAAADLVRQGKIAIDIFKCPAWPHLIPTIQATLPTYIHFPLRVGAGIGDAIDFETGRPADWAKMEALFAQTQTPLLNLHLSPTVEEYPDIPPESTAPEHIERLVAAMVRDIEIVVRRFGKENVIAENDYDGGNRTPQAACTPEAVYQTITAAGCGFLCDLSHARLTAKRFGMTIDEYLNGLPLVHLREIHITGIQYVDAHWVGRLERANIPPSKIQEYAGKTIDHLPMIDDDWTFFQWAVEQIHLGRWAEPWVIAFEYGGVGPVWEAVTDAAILEAQIPRLVAMMKRGL